MHRLVALRASQILANSLRGRTSMRHFKSCAPALRKHMPLGNIPEGTDRNEVREKWGSNAMDMIEEAEPIIVDGPVAACNGGGGALGHPIEYIKLYVSDEDAAPQVCKYCGLRYQRKRAD